ncbi:MAG TPA: stage V sporulation protein AD [Ruminococcus sp.]|nr:stage V sporulation protein AD [Ruminococcus sp.]
MVAQAARTTNVPVTCAKAFGIGGSICLIGEMLRQMLLHSGLPSEEAGTWVSVILVFCSALLTGLGIYEKLAKHGGAGTLVPITGFANAVSAAAVEAKTEGFILGVGTKIFTIAGPVLLYGTAAASLYGAVYWLMQQTFR